MKAAFAVTDGIMAASLGAASAFVLLDDDLRQERAVCSGNIPLFLKSRAVGVLVCGGIGGCMKDLLASMGINVIPGVSGAADEVIARYLAGTLVPGEKYSCADHGRTCGECPGTF